MMGREPLLRNLLGNNRGSAAAEMALISMLFIFILLSVADFGSYIYFRMQVKTAAQAAVSTAAITCNTQALLPALTKCSDIMAKMQASAQTTSLGAAVSIDEPEHKPVEGYYCHDASFNLQVVTPPSNCASVLAGSTEAPAYFISVTAFYRFRSLFPGMPVASILTSPITETAWMRLG